MVQDLHLPDIDVEGWLVSGQEACEGFGCMGTSASALVSHTWGRATVSISVTFCVITKAHTEGARHEAKEWA